MIKIQKLKTIRKPISSKAEIVLLGLTPGRQQHQAFNNLKNPRHGAFKGQMRTRLYNYFKFLGIVKHYNLVDKDDMFLRDDLVDKVHFTSLLREPVYYENGKNYSGRSPVPWRDAKLVSMINDTVKVLEEAPSVFIIIPCGDIVAKSLGKYLDKTLHERVLFGFPHPSPLNAHADKKFEDCKHKLKKQVKSFLTKK